MPEFPIFPEWRAQGKERRGENNGGLPKLRIRGIRNLGSPPLSLRPGNLLPGRWEKIRGGAGGARASYVLTSRVKSYIEES